MSTLDTSLIIPTHNNFRSPQKAKELIEVKDYCDYILNNQRSPIILIQTEDKQLWCHDGHHRLAAVDWNYGRIDEKYIEIIEHTYKELNQVNLRCGYVTPYNPRSECRLPNFWDYKQELLSYIETVKYWWSDINPYVGLDILKLINENTVVKPNYKEPRKIHTLRELCHTLSLSQQTPWVE